jgi:hypothetical protein
MISRFHSNVVKIEQQNKCKGFCGFVCYATRTSLSWANAVDPRVSHNKGPYHLNWVQRSRREPDGPASFSAWKTRENALKGRLRLSSAA